MSDKEHISKLSASNAPHESVIDEGKRMLERKIKRNRWAIYFERLWLKAWPLIALILIFFIIGLLGGWSAMHPLLHRILIGVGVIACLSCFVLLCRVRFATKEEGLARLDRFGTLPHRPASSFDDTIAEDASPQTKSIWKAYRTSLVRKIDALKVKAPRPQSERFDPFGLRVILPLLFIAALFAGRGHLGASVASAFDFAPLQKTISVKMNAWINPPTYTSRPPIMLAEKEFGGDAFTSDEIAVAKPFQDIPQGSKISIRLNGAKGAALGNLSVRFLKEHKGPGDELLSLEDKNAQKKAEKTEKQTGPNVGDRSPDEPRFQDGGHNDVQPVAKTYQFALKESGTMMVTRGGKTMEQWVFTVRPDVVPSIGLMKMPQRAKSGALMLNHYVDDDYGVQSAVAGIITKGTVGDAAKLKALNSHEQRFTALQRAMLAPETPADTDLSVPLSGPIQFPLDLSNGTTKGTRREGQTIQNLIAHPWAGQDVHLLLMARDDFGHRGFSPPLAFVLPSRAFENPIAKEIIEARRQLISVPAFRKRVRGHIRAVQHIIAARKMDKHVYLGLSAAYYQLGIYKRRSELIKTVELLWKLALRMEDGDLSDAERRLRDARKALEQALKEGASDKEITKAMKELRSAMQEYLKAMAKAQKDQKQDQTDQAQNPNTKTLNSEDIKRMLDQIEQAMKSGSKDAAKQMLAQLQQMLENVQKPNQSQAGNQNGKQDNAAGKLGEMMKEQQQLMEETFQERRKKDDPRARSLEERQGQNGKDGEKGEEGQSAQKGEKGQDGQDGKDGRGQEHGQNGQQGQQGEGGKQGQQGQNGQSGPNGSKGHHSARGQEREGQNGASRLGNKGPQSGRSSKGAKGGKGSLSQRQKGLSQKLGEMLGQMEKGGMKVPGGLRDAQKSMSQAERSLRRKQHPFAMRQQGRALEQLRKGAQQLQKQMGKQQQNAQGKPGGQRDPFGRRSGANGGFNEGVVKIPGAEDMKRAGEIMKELRDKLSNPQRPNYEREYFERLLERF